MLHRHGGFLGAIAEGLGIGVGIGISQKGFQYLEDADNRKKVSKAAGKAVELFGLFCICGIVAIVILMRMR